MDKRLLLVLLCLQAFLLITASETETAEGPPVERNGLDLRRLPGKKPCPRNSRCGRKHLKLKEPTPEPPEFRPGSYGPILTH